MVAVTYRLQELWTAWNLNAVRGLFALRFTAENTGSIPPGPILVLSRPASLVDTLLPDG